MAGEHYTSHTVEEVFKDFKGRRDALVKALTTDVKKFYKECDPEKENLSLFGMPNGNWEVDLPMEEVPPELPEPVLGINFAREGMHEKDWLSLVAIHSDAWLYAVAFYFGARFAFDKNDRRRLFQMINELPTVHEVVTGIDKKQQREKSASTPNSSNKSKSSSKAQAKQFESQMKASKMQLLKYDGYSGDEEDEQGQTLCAKCGHSYADDEFWIFCDICERWYHGDCVNITPAKAEQIKQYRCPACCGKRGRL